MRHWKLEDWIVWPCVWLMLFYAVVGQDMEWSKLRTVEWDAIGALATFIAVVAALHISRQEQLRAREEREEGSRAIAAIIWTDLSMLDGKLDVLRQILDDQVMEPAIRAQALHSHVTGLQLTVLQLALSNFSFVKKPCAQALAGLMTAVVELKTQAERWASWGDALRYQDNAIGVFFENSGISVDAAKLIIARTRPEIASIAGVQPLVPDESDTAKVDAGQ